MRHPSTFAADCQLIDGHAREAELGTHLAPPLPPMTGFSCTSAERAQVRAVLGRAVTEAELRRTVGTAIAQAQRDALAASSTLRARPRSGRTSRIFRSIFNVPPTFVPAWRPGNASWRDLGELVALRIENGSRILGGGYMHFFCWGSAARCPECTEPPTLYRACSSYQGRHHICLGREWWEWYRDGHRGFMASTLLHEAMHIYFRLEHHKATVGRPSVNNMYCYDTLVAILSGRTPKPGDRDKCASKLQPSDHEDNLAEVWAHQPPAAALLQGNSPAEAAADAVRLRSTLRLMQLDAEMEDTGLVERARGLLAFFFAPPLQVGSTGRAVTVLQDALSRLGYPVTVDGRFGPRTRVAVRAFQAHHGLCLNGIAGRQTQGAIGRAFAHLTDPAAQPLPAEIVQVAQSQLRYWQSGPGHYRSETDPAVTPILLEYYRDGVCDTIVSTADLQSPAWHSDNAWSAAFVSWVMRSAGAGSAFKYSAAHRNYVRAARNNRCQNNTANPFWAYRVTEVAPEPGDLVCRADEKTAKGVVVIPRATYDTVAQPRPYWPMHCDIVTTAPQGGKILVVGGNVAIPGGNPNRGLTVAERPMSVQADGKLDQIKHPHHIAIVRCRGPAPGVPQPC